MNQKLLKTLGIVMACFVVFILLIFLISSCSKKKYTYSQLENLMVSKAKEHYQNNKKELPQNDGDIKEYTLDEMIKKGEIKELDKILDKNENCNGKVMVINNNKHYIYEPNLTCKNYSTQKFNEKIISDNTTTSGSGLYEYGSQHIFKGDNVNNYVSLNGKLFRIIRINNDGTIRMIDITGISDVIWDYKFNEDTNYVSGINDYLVKDDLYANLKIVSDNYYNNDYAWTDESRSYITTQSVCIGKRSLDDTTKDGTTECSKMLDNQQLTSLAIYEYLQASLDDNCSYTTDSSCTNYNWISSITASFWSVTALTDSTDYVYEISGKPFTIVANSRAYFNPVFNISDKTIYVSGDGSEENPYIFK